MPNLGIGKYASPHVKPHFPRLELLTLIRKWVKKKSKRIQWNLECHQALQIFSRVGHAGRKRISMNFK